MALSNQEVLLFLFVCFLIKAFRSHFLMLRVWTQFLSQPCEPQIADVPRNRRVSLELLPLGTLGRTRPPRAASPPCPAPRRGTALRGGHVLPPDAWGFAFARRSCPRPVGTTVAVPTFQHRFSHADNTVAAITDELPRRRASRRAGSFFGHEAPGTRWVALSAWRPAFWTLSGARLCPPFVRAASTPTTFPPALLTPLPGRAPRGF